MAIDQYRFWTEWSEEDGESAYAFPLVSWLEPDREAADSGFRTVVSEAIEDLAAEVMSLGSNGQVSPSRRC